MAKVSRTRDLPLPAGWHSRTGPGAMLLAGQSILFRWLPIASFQGCDVRPKPFHIEQCMRWQERSSTASEDMLVVGLWQKGRAMMCSLACWSAVLLNQGRVNLVSQIWNTLPHGFWYLRNRNVKEWVFVFSTSYYGKTVISRYYVVIQIG